MNKVIKAYENHLDAQEAKWFAVYTRYKGEKMVFRQLARKGVTAYLPLQKFVRSYTRKVKVVELPLISCYVFVKITTADYVKVLETEQVQDFVRFSRNLISIPEEEIQLMKRLLEEGWEIQSEQKNLVQGDIVEIGSGNLAGLRGKLVAQSDKNQMVVDLDRLGYSLRISVDKSLLVKVQS